MLNLDPSDFHPLLTPYTPGLGLTAPPQSQPLVTPTPGPDVDPQKVARDAAWQAYYAANPGVMQSASFGGEYPTNGGPQWPPGYGPQGQPPAGASQPTPGAASQPGAMQTLGPYISQIVNPPGGGGFVAPPQSPPLLTPHDPSQPGAGGQGAFQPLPGQQQPLQTPLPGAPDAPAQPGALAQLAQAGQGVPTLDPPPEALASFQAFQQWAQQNGQPATPHSYHVARAQNDMSAGVAHPSPGAGVGGSQVENAIDDGGLGSGVRGGSHGNVSGAQQDAYNATQTSATPAAPGVAQQRTTQPVARSGGFTAPPAPEMLVHAPPEPPRQQPGQQGGGILSQILSLLGQQGGGQQPQFAQPPAAPGMTGPNPNDPLATPYTPLPNAPNAALQDKMGPFDVAKAQSMDPYAAAQIGRFDPYSVANTPQAQAYQTAQVGRFDPYSVSHVGAANPYQTAQIGAPPTPEEYARAIHSSFAPMEDQAMKDLAARQAAMGTLTSGAGNYGMQDLAAKNVATEAGAVAPLIQQGFGQQFQANVGNAGAANNMLQQLFSANQQNRQFDASNDTASNAAAFGANVNAAGQNAGAQNNMLQNLFQAIQQGNQFNAANQNTANSAAFGANVNSAGQNAAATNSANAQAFGANAGFNAQNAQALNAMLQAVFGQNAQAGGANQNAQNSLLGMQYGGQVNQNLADQSNRFAMRNLLQNQGFQAQQNNQQMAYNTNLFNAQNYNDTLRQNNAYQNQFLQDLLGFGHGDYQNILSNLAGLNATGLGNQGSILGQGMNNQYQGYMDGQTAGAGYAGQIASGGPGSFGGYNYGSGGTYLTPYQQALQNTATGSAMQVGQQQASQGNAADPYFNYTPPSQLTGLPNPQATAIGTAAGMPNMGGGYTPGSGGYDQPGAGAMGGGP